MTPDLLAEIDAALAALARVRAAVAGTADGAPDPGKVLPPVVTCGKRPTRRIAVARLLAAAGPLSVRQVADRHGINPSVVYLTVRHPWFRRLPSGHYDLSPAGVEFVTNTPAGPPPSPPTG